MIGQARWLATQSAKIIVKIPMTVEGIEVVIRLKRGSPEIPLAVTGSSNASWR
jgi:transaldolase